MEFGTQSQFLEKAFDKREVLAYLGSINENTKLAVLMLELVDFNKWLSLYNPALYTMTRDKILAIVSEIFPNNAHFFHIFDDTFLVLFEGVDINRVIEFSQTLRMAFIEKDKDEDLDLSLFVGIAEGGVNSIMQKAFSALKYSKKVLSEVYYLNISDDDFSRILQNNINIRTLVRRAIFEGNIVPFYQPIFNNKTNSITKFECLARIVNGNDIIQPGSFVKVARQIGCMRRITFSVINHSFSVFANNNYEFSINITEEDLRDKQVIEYLQHSCEKFSIDPQRVIIELLEDIEFGDDNIIVNNILHLRNLGFKIAIDDFGSANSNFYRLMKMSVDYIKIDGSFVKRMIDDEMSRKIVKSIASFASSMSIECIAEHVYSQEIQDIIKELEIPYSQGFYIGKASYDLPIETR